VVQGGEFAITDEPQMPVITAQLQIIGPVTATINEWICRVLFAGADDCHNIPNFGVINDDLEPTQAGGAQFTPSFNKIRGRGVSFTVSFAVEGQLNEEFAFADIKGTNPQRSDVQTELRDPRDADDVLKKLAKRYQNALIRIACRESGQRQFDAEADGGLSRCPLYSSDRRGRVGIMQIPDPTPDHIWNWRLNVVKGIELFNDKVDAARDYPNKVRNSDEFKTLVSRFNQRRQGQGLNPIQVVLPPFSEGDFGDNLQQLELDAIRGYNGWNGSDRFGLELHEFRVAVDGENVLAVSNVNEETLQGEAAWERVPVADRPDEGSPNYVEEVLAIGFDCSPRTVPLTVSIHAERGGDPCRILAIGKSRKYRATVAPAGGTIVWTCIGGASIVGSPTAELITVRGDTVSATLDDVVLRLDYLRGLLNSQSQEIKLTVADVTKITVRVKASAAMTPGRAASLDDHRFDCTETVEAFPPDKSLILLRGDFEDVELQATVNPTGTPLAWDCKRASDDHSSLGAGLPKLDPDPDDKTKAKLKQSETGSFFVRVFGDCGDQKFDPSVPFKLVPTVLVRATLHGVDASTTHPENTNNTLPTIVIGPINFVDVETGTFDIEP
jgi:hypothetical protein